MDRYDELNHKILPQFTAEKRTKRFLKALAVSDGKAINIFRRASLSRTEGYSTYHSLHRAGLVYKEESREPVEPRRRGQKRKKALRNYTVQAKMKFHHPFHRFWYTFIVPHAESIEANDYTPFFEALDTSLDRYVSFTFEELSNALIKEVFAHHDPISEKGAYWDRHNEFDLLARTQTDRLIIGECKWKGHKVCKSLVSKLKSKCEKSGLKPDYLALFSKSGFSNELKNSKDPSLLCYDLKDFERLLR